MFTAEVSTDLNYGLFSLSSRVSDLDDLLGCLHVFDVLRGGAAVVLHGEVEADEGHDQGQEAQLEGQEDHAEPEVAWD